MVYNINTSNTTDDPVVPSDVDLTSTIETLNSFIRRINMHGSPPFNLGIYKLFKPRAHQCSMSVKHWRPFVPQSPDPSYVLSSGNRKAENVTLRKWLPAGSLATSPYNKAAASAIACQAELAAPLLTRSR